MKIPIDRCNGLVYKLLSVKINHIHRFRTNTVPQGLELRHSELIRINLQLHILVTGILRLHGTAVIDGIENIDYGIPAVCHLLRNPGHAVCFVGVILIGQYTFFVDIAVDDQIKEDGLRRIAVHDLLVASGIHNDLALEEVGSNSHRTSGNSIGKLSLQALCKAVIALTGDDGQNIDGLHIISKHVGVHTLAVLIDAQAQTATDLLPLANLAAALFQCTNLKHVRIVPAFAQCGVGENETHRGFFRITIQKQFLVLHDQVIGVNIIGCAFLLVGKLAVGHLALFVNGEVTGMGVMGGNCVQIPYVVLVSDFPLHGAENIVVFFLKHIGVDAIEGLARLVILLVLGHLVNEEQRQDFDSLMEKLALPFQMGKNRFPNLNAAKLVIADLADHISCINLDTVQELHGVVPPVNVPNHKTIFIFVKVIGVIVEIISFGYCRRFLANTVGTFVVKLNGCCRVSFGKIDAFQVNKAIGCRAAGLGNALDGNFLDQPLIVRLHRVKAVHHVIDAVRLVGCGIAECQQRAKFFQPFLGLLAFHRLGLVNNQDWIRLCDNINRAAGTKLVQFHVNAPCILPFGVECLGIDDHNIDGAVRRKAVNFRKLCRIVDEEPDLLAVFLRKMLLGHLKGFVNTFSNGDAGYNHDELTPTVVLVQLVHGLDIGIGLADTCLHFNGQVITALQLVRRFDLVGALYLLQMLQNQLFGKLRHNALVAPAGEVRVICHRLLAVASVHQIGGGQIRLSGENVNDCFCRIRLKFLMFELEFHLSTPS